MFRYILFPVDFTGSSVQVVPYVKDIAEKYNARVNVLHVVSDLGGELYVTGEAMVNFMSEIRNSAQEMMNAYLEENFGGLPNVYGHIVEGDPVEEILQFAAENEEGLIVMGTHGRKGLDRVVFGSVAENVTRTSPLPVLLVNPHLVNTSAVDKKD